MADKKIAEIHLEMYDTENGIRTENESNGTGTNIMLLIADYIVNISQENSFNYKFMLDIISEFCKDMKKECEEC